MIEKMRANSALLLLVGEGATEARVGKTWASIEHGREVEDGVGMAAVPADTGHVAGVLCMVQRAYICRAFARSWMYSMQLGRNSTK